MTSAGPIGERQSPHTSPRISRRSTTPSLMAVQNDLYAASTITSLSVASLVNSGNMIVPSTANCNVSNGSSGGGSAEKSNNRMSAPLICAVAKQVNNNSHINSNSFDTAAWIYGQRVPETSTPSGSISANKDNNTTYSVLSQCQESLDVKHITSVVTSTTTAYTSKPTNEINISTTPHCSNGINNSTETINNDPIFDDIQKFQQAPPLPPRKSSPGVSESSFQQSSNCSGVMNKVYGCAGVTLNASSPNESVDILKSDDLDMTFRTGFPLPTQSSSITAQSMGEMMRQLGHVSTPCIKTARSIIDEDIEVGPAETIMGLIDTRPLEARQVAPTLIPQNSTVDTEINLAHFVSTSPHYIHISETKSQASTVSVVSNDHPDNSLDIYQQQRNQLQFLQQQRLQQYYQQLQHLQKQSGSVKQLPQSTNLNEQMRNEQRFQQHNHSTENSFLYNNVTINPKDCSNVPYENINLDYVNRLISDGYTKEHAISALVISRNNIEMACEILREFVSKSSF